MRLRGELTAADSHSDRQNGPRTAAQRRGPLSDAGLDSSVPPSASPLFYGDWQRGFPPQRHLLSYIRGGTMPRYGLVCSQTGNFHGDTGRISGADLASPVDAALALDRAMGRAPRGYGRARAGSCDAIFDVYRLEPSPRLSVDASDDQCLAHARKHGTHVATLISYVS